MVRCYVDLLAEQPEEAAICLERITAGTQRLEVLINGMFECFQLAEHFAPKAVDMNMVYLNALSRLSPADRTGLSGEDLPKVQGDFEMLTEVLSRLIDNAMKFRSSEPPVVRLTAVREAAPSDQWRFSITDNGIGVEEAQWERCFGMFKRLHARDVPGEGFGLAYCRRAVDLHGGRIWMESAPGAGTSIHFTLPAA